LGSFGFGFLFATRLTSLQKAELVCNRRAAIASQRILAHEFKYLDFYLDEKITSVSGGKNG
jgi:hypothetical protein